jgi:hypothetical protein
MKKFLIRLLFFLVIPLVLFTAGYFFLGVALDDEILHPSLESKIQALEIDTAGFNIIVTGDSRAERHLSPAVIKHHTGFNTINIGFTGNDLLTTLAAIKKYYPGTRFLFVVSASSWQINDGAISPGYLSLKCFQEMTFVEKFMIYKKKLSELRRLEVQLMEQYVKSITGKLLNKKADEEHDPQIIREQGFFGVTGFIKNSGDSDLKKITQAHQFYKNVKNNGIRWNIFRDAMQEIGNMNSTFIIIQPPASPVWKKFTDNNFIGIAEKEYSEKLCSEAAKYPNITCLDHYRNEIKELNDSMYYDIQHLNRKGAEFYSALVSQQIMLSLEKNKK